MSDIKMSLRLEAFRRHSALKAAMVPDDVNWYIDEYDDAEHVAERHRTWN